VRRKSLVEFSQRNNKSFSGFTGESNLKLIGTFIQVSDFTSSKVECSSDSLLWTNNNGVCDIRGTVIGQKYIKIKIQKKILVLVDTYGAIRGMVNLRAPLIISNWVKENAASDMCTSVAGLVNIRYKCFSSVV